jgi:hypothetical protein
MKDRSRSTVTANPGKLNPLTADERVGIALYFDVKVDGRSLGWFTGVKGLIAEHEVFEWAEGGENGFVHRLPGRLKFRDITLSRCTDPSTVPLATGSTPSGPTAASTAVPSPRTTPKARRSSVYELRDVWPIRYSGPVLDTVLGGLARETLDLAHSGFTVCTRRPSREAGQADPGRRARFGELQLQPAPRWRSRRRELELDARPQHPLAPPPEFVGTAPAGSACRCCSTRGHSRCRRSSRRSTSCSAGPVPTKETLRAQQPQPPLVTLDWGGAPPARAWLVALGDRHVPALRCDGKPVRATVNLVLERDADRGSCAEPDVRGRARHPPAHVRRRRLPGLCAAQEYGDAGQWRALAAANGIDDPLRVPSGRSLIVPPAAAPPPSGRDPHG